MTLLSEGDKFECRYCDAPVVYAFIQVGARRTLSFALDAEPIPNGPYHIEEEEVEGVATGQWLATYFKVAERNGANGHRKHDCPAKKRAPK